MTLDQLFRTASRDETAAIALLLKQPSLATEVDIAGDYQRGTASPALVHAAHRGLTRLVDALLDAGADIRRPGVDGGTALHVAAWMGHDETVQLLLKRGAPINVLCTAYRGTPVLWAVHGAGPGGAVPAGNHREVIRLLLGAGADVSVPNADGLTPVELVPSTDPHQIRCLLESG